MGRKRERKWGSGKCRLWWGEGRDGSEVLWDKGYVHHSFTCDGGRIPGTGWEVFSRWSLPRWVSLFPASLSEPQPDQSFPFLMPLNFLCSPCYLPLRLHTSSLLYLSRWFLFFRFPSFLSTLSNSWSTHLLHGNILFAFVSLLCIFIGYFRTFGWILYIFVFVFASPFSLV